VELRIPKLRKGSYFLYRLRFLGHQIEPYAATAAV
jgi:hypothetical protein